MFFAESVLRLEFKFYADLDEEVKYVKSVGLLYVYEPTRCTKFYMFSTVLVWLLCGYSHKTAGRMVSTYTKCDVQLVKLLLMID